MTLDPVFAFNRDLDDVANVRTAVRRVRCDGGDIDMDNSVIETASGQMIQLEEGANPSVIMRQDGQTMRGVGVMAAALIERQQPAGQSEIIEDRTPMLVQAAPSGTLTSGSSSDGGCACDSHHNKPNHLWWCILFAWPMIRRRR